MTEIDWSAPAPQAAIDRALSRRGDPSVDDAAAHGRFDRSHVR